MTLSRAPRCRLFEGSWLTGVGLLSTATLVAAPWWDLAALGPGGKALAALGAVWCLWEAGRAVLHALVPQAPASALWGLALPLGALWVAAVLTLLAAAHIFHPPTAVLGAAVPGWASHIWLRHKKVLLLLPQTHTWPSWLRITVTVSVLLVTVVNLAPTLYYDALVYHYAVPALYLDAGGFVWLPGLVCSYYPFLEDLLNAVGIAADPFGVPANLVGCALGLSVVPATVHLARRTCAHPNAPALAAGLLLTSPLILGLLVIPSNDLAVAAFAAASGVALAEYAVTRLRTWRILAAVLLGGALFSKNAPALQVAPAMLLLLLWVEHRAQTPNRVILYRAALFTATAVLVASPTLVRNAVFTGNPFFPVAWSWLGGSGWSALEAEGFAMETNLRPWGWATLSGVPMLMVRAFLLAIPGVARDTPGTLLGISLLLGGALAVRRTHLRPALALWAALTALWAVTSPQVRLLATACVVTALLGGEAWAWMWDGLKPPAQRGVLALAAAALLVNAWLTLDTFAVWQGAFVPVALGLQNPQSYVEERLGYAQAGAAARAMLPAGKKVIMLGEGRTFHFQAPVIPTAAVNRSPLLDALETELSLEQVHAQVEGWGVGAILVDNNEWSRLAQSYAVTRLTPFGKARLVEYLSTRTRLIWVSPDHHTSLHLLTGLE